MKINLGCGPKAKEGYINVDLFDTYPNVDVVHDLNKYPWPFKEDSADEIKISHLLEHLDDQKKALEEVYRILKPGGKLCLHQDPFW